MKRLTQCGVLAVVGAMSVAMTACSLDNLLNVNDPPAGSIVDPSAVSTYEGALGLYRAALFSMDSVVLNTSREVGVFTDELSASDQISLDGRTWFGADSGVVATSYTDLQTARIRAAQSSELLLRHGTSASYPLLGHAYAIQAHAILMMAELFCSGIPLTDVPFERDLKLSAGLSTTTLLERAVALFDTAYTYGKDSLPIATFARVGKGRALLNLGRYADAAAAVAGVTTDAQYRTTFTQQPPGSTVGMAFWTKPENSYDYDVLSPEGSNGIRWAADSVRLQDRRVLLDTVSSVQFASPLKQRKYTGAVEIVVVADGIQARMIEAEAQLQPANAPQGPWLTTLNAARATRGLSPLTDPGTAAARIDMLFRERALWFYLNGQRLGDMRRLVRNYGRLPNQVYPAGPYPYLNSAVVVYGPEYVFVPPRAEQQYNPLYKGCIDKRP